MTHHYSIEPSDPGAHLFTVTVRVERPNPDGQSFRFPAWIPGSYLIRDFARNVVSIRAESDGLPVTLTKTDKSTWQADPCEQPLTLVTEVYAQDLSVRGAHLDTTHAFFSGPAVFPAVQGQEDVRCELDIVAPSPPTGSDWRVATSMRPKTAERFGYGVYTADNYDELIDHPVENGRLRIGEFEVDGIPHAIAVRGHDRFDMARVCRDLACVCAEHHRLLGAPTDLDRCLFQLLVLGKGYGGLEHRWSTSLVCSRQDLPVTGESEVSSGYRKFLGLCSHEYFHLWNVTRMRPEVLRPYRLQAESHTGLLWVFEGITSYYDDLALARAGLVTMESYLELLGQTMTRVLRSPGRLRQSVEESSYDAWTRFYKQDAGSPNFIVSYYAKGALVALALDLTLRGESGGACTLDDVMRECWRRFGETGDGMPERGIETIASEICGVDLSEFFERYVRGTAELPLEALLRSVGIRVALRAAVDAGDAGGKPAQEGSRALPWFGSSLSGNGGRATFGTVRAGSPAERAGLAPGDEAVALDGLKLDAASLTARLAEYRVGDAVTLSVFRRDELMHLNVTLTDAPLDTCYLAADDDPSADQYEARNRWLKR